MPDAPSTFSTISTFSSLSNKSKWTRASPFLSPPAPSALPAPSAPSGTNRSGPAPVPSCRLRQLEHCQQLQHPQEQIEVDPRKFLPVAYDRISIVKRAS